MIPKFRVFYLDKMREVLAMDFESRTMKVKVETEGGNAAATFYDVSMEEHPPSAFIGLLDKNKTEIFEGDIVECGAFRGLIVWSAFAAGFWTENMRGEMGLPLDEITWMDYEVIGNRWEHPELLEGKE